MITVEHFSSGTRNVKVDSLHLVKFASKWPCFGNVEEHDEVAFTFDRRGDLVDATGERDFDSGGIAALCDDMRALAFEGKRAEWMD